MAKFVKELLHEEAQVLFGKLLFICDWIESDMLHVDLVQLRHKMKSVIDFKCKEEGITDNGDDRHED